MYTTTGLSKVCPWQGLGNRQLGWLVVVGVLWWWQWINGSGGGGFVGGDSNDGELIGVSVPLRFSSLRDHALVTQLAGGMLCVTVIHNVFCVCR
jgi:hypothetical protein